MQTIANSISVRQPEAQHVKGIVLILISSLFFAAMVVGVRLLMPEYSPFKILFYRSGIQSLILLPVFLFLLREAQARQGVKDRFKFLTLRSAFGIGSMVSYYYSIEYLSLGLVSLFGMTSVFWATLAARLFFGERWTKNQALFALLTCVGIGLAAIPPPSKAVWLVTGIGIFFGLFGSSIRGGALVLLTQLRKEGGSVEIVFFFGMFGLLAAVPGYVLEPQWPATPQEWKLLLLVGTTATGAQLFMTAGFKYTNTLNATTTNLLGIFANVFVGMFFFGEYPPWYFYLATGIVIVGVIGLVKYSSKPEQQPMTSTV